MFLRLFRWKTCCLGGFQCKNTVFLVFNEKYGFIFDRNTKKVDNFNLSFGFAYRYTNFSINTFYLEPIASQGSSHQDEHQVRIYRFWSFDPLNNIPNETSYFVKLINIINYNNPVYSKSRFNEKFGPIRKDPYPRENKSNIANYLMHSEYVEFYWF